MSVEIGDYIRIRRKFVNGKRNETGSIGIPIPNWIISREYLPERDWAFIGIAFSEKINGVKIATEVDDIAAE